MTRSSSDTMKYQGRSVRRDNRTFIIVLVRKVEPNASCSSFDGAGRQGRFLIQNDKQLNRWKGALKIHLLWLKWLVTGYRQK